MEKENKREIHSGGIFCVIKRSPIKNTKKICVFLCENQRDLREIFNSNLLPYK